MLNGSKVSTYQENIVIEGSGIQGTLKFHEDSGSPANDGYWLILDMEASGGSTTAELSDSQSSAFKIEGTENSWALHLDTATQNLTVTATSETAGTASKVFDLSMLVFSDNLGA